ncbi:hypothetical protein KKHLCK_13380 [Candidatus Electrothrix laxa]
MQVSSITCIILRFSSLLNSRFMGPIRDQDSETQHEPKTIHHSSFLLLNILSSGRMPCYSRGMKIYTQYCCSNCQAAIAKPFKSNNIVFTLIFLLATGFFPCREFVPAVYGAETGGKLPVKRSEWSFPLRYSITDETIQPRKSKKTKKSLEVHSPRKKTFSDAIKQKIMRANSPMQQSRMVNSWTCGRPWKSRLTQIHGRIRNVEYRVQPMTGRRGLHLDIETGGQIDTIIHVYPERLTVKCPSVFYFTVGDMVNVIGSEFFTGKGGVQQNICAAKITQEDKVLGVRDPLTGDLERQLCCQEICEKNCVGFPLMCDQMCMGSCRNRRMQAIFQNLPYQHPSWDKDYATTTFDH